MQQASNDAAKSQPAQKYVKRLIELFSAIPDKHAAHDKSREIMQELAADQSAMTGILTSHLQKPESLNKTHYPTVGIDVALNAYFGLVANFWIPLPNGATDLSTKAIHHHGELLLSTATAFGPGYEHWTFKKPVVMDAERELFRLDLIERAQHGLHDVAFVDSYVAHLPMFPKTLSITWALWSDQRPVTWRDRLKRMPMVKGHEKQLRTVAAKLGLVKALNIKIANYFDFYPTPDGFRGMKERQEFEHGPNCDYLYSLFHILQGTGNEALAPIIRAKVMSGGVDDANLVNKLLGDLELGTPIPGKLSDGHYTLAHANFRSTAIEQALAAQNSVVSVSAGSQS